MKHLLSGNEAIARGAYEAGVRVCSAYPGTPSTEIFEQLPQYQDELYCEWAPNEKVAAEVAYGAAIAGVRSLCAMKHVLTFPHNLQENLCDCKSACAISPQSSQICTLYLSLTSTNLSLRKRAAPCEIMQSLSISPNLKPPLLALPSVGCLVKICTGPLALENILSSTICFNLW